jgi:uncharacterized protein YjbI with pentapeptide repeats
MDTPHPIHSSLRITKDSMYLLLREGCITEFNARRAAGDEVDLCNCDLRNLDLRGLDAKGLDLSGCYMRQSDLRGVDFRQARLEGASINAAKISGAYFPDELTAAEIELSLLHGSRMRYRVEK